MAILMTNHESVTTKKAAKEFKKAAADYTSKVTSSQKKTRATLVTLGTHGKDGRLTKKYSK
jgi:hypothetical protein